MYSTKMPGISIIKNYIQIAFKDQQAFKSKSKDIFNKKRFLFTILSCFFALQVFGQQTGNTVEILGSKRGETSGESAVIHQFTEGFALRYAMNGGFLTGYQDILFRQIAPNRFSIPYDQKNIDVYPLHASISLIWEAIDADSLGVFVKIPKLHRAIRGDKISATITLINSQGIEVDRITFQVNDFNERQYHERTFLNNINGSVQYYSVVPSSNYLQGQGVLPSLHGASVEATSHERGYIPKEWAHIVAPTNRRPFGYNGEESYNPNNYFSGITGFPDLLIFDINWIRDGLNGMHIS